MPNDRFDDGGIAVNSFAQPDAAVVKAIVRAHAWLKMILDGEVRSVYELARSVRRDVGYVRRVLQLAFLHPSSTASLLSEGASDTTASDLLALQLPCSWRQQTARVEASCHGSNGTIKL